MARRPKDRLLSLTRNTWHRLVRHDIKQPEIVIFLRDILTPLIDCIEFGDEGLSYVEALDMLFGATHRKVISAVACTKFKMPGYYRPQAERYWPIAGPRHVAEGTMILIRHDYRSPNFVDIETFKDWYDNEGAEFRLSIPQFRHIIPKITNEGEKRERLYALIRRPRD